MAKSPAVTGPRLCPTCGTRIGAAATKCLVCGTELTVVGGLSGAAASRPGPAISRGTYTTLLILFAVVLVAAVVVLLMAFSGIVPPVLAPATATPTSTATIPPTVTPMPTATETPLPTETPPPPIDYTVKAGDMCSGLAAEFHVSVQSIIQLNNLDPNCTLTVGRALKIPHPTPTPTPPPTATVIGNFATPAPVFTYTVHAGDTCGGIAAAYRITVVDLTTANGLPDNCGIQPGQILIIPFKVTPGPTPTPTPLPPYPPPYQLVPAAGQQFIRPEDKTVTLQWTSVGELRENEVYEVTVEDVTCNCARLHKQTTTENKLLLPEDLRPTDNTPHLFIWTVTTLRQTGTAASEIKYESAGATSPERGFIWSGSGAAPAP